MGKMKEAICLLNSMVECGEKHSKVSRKAVCEALAENAPIVKLPRNYDKSKSRTESFLSDAFIAGATVMRDKMKDALREAGVKWEDAP